MPAVARKPNHELTRPATTSCTDSSRRPFHGARYPGELPNFSDRIDAEPAVGRQHLTGFRQSNDRFDFWRALLTHSYAAV
jgi:hypothetical protein